MAESLYEVTPWNSLSSFRVNKITELEKASSFVNEMLKTLEAVYNQVHKYNIALKKENEELKATKT